jgi:hypothetical protein
MKHLFQPLAPQPGRKVVLQVTAELNPRQRQNITFPAALASSTPRSSVTTDMKMSVVVSQVKACQPVSIWYSSTHCSVRHEGFCKYGFVGESAVAAAVTTPSLG